MLNTGFFWILSSGAIYGLIHSALASNDAKSVALCLFKSGGMKYYRFFFVVVASITTLAYISLSFLFPDQPIYRIPFPWWILTGILQLGALLGAILSMFATKIMPFLGLDVVFNPNISTPSEKLNTGGLYRYMRHPIYSFSFILIWLSPVMTWNLLGLFIGVTLYTVIGSIFEEKKLIQAFGEDYIEYKIKTPAFFPNLFHK